MRLGRLPVVHLSDPPMAWPAARRAVLLVPGEDAIVLSFEMPTKVRRSAADRITFFAVQDLVGEDMEDLHFVRLPRGAEDGPEQTRAIVTSRTSMDAWLRRAEEVGLRLAGILPDYLALPWTPGEWTVSTEPSRLRVRFGRFDGFAAEPGLGAAILERRLKDTAPSPSRIRLLGAGAAEAAAPDNGDGNPAERALDALLARIGEAGVPVGREALPAGVPQFRHGEFDANLIAGAYSESLGLLQEVSRWGVPAGLAAAALLAWALDIGLTLREEQAELEVLDRSIEELFRAEFVPDGPIMDIRLQAARSLETLRAQPASARSAGGFLVLLAAGSETLAENDRRVSRLSYRDGVLTAEVTLADFRALERLNAELADKRLEVEVQSSAASGEEGVNATIVLRPGEASR